MFQPGTMEPSGQKNVVLFLPGKIKDGNSFFFFFKCAFQKVVNSDFHPRFKQFLTIRVKKHFNQKF